MGYCKLFILAKFNVLSMVSFIIETAAWFKQPQATARLDGLNMSQKGSALGREEPITAAKGICSPRAVKFESQLSRYRTSKIKGVGAKRE